MSLCDGTKHLCLCAGTAQGVGLKTMKIWCIITQRGMSNNKWCVVEINQYFEMPIVRSPFGTKEEASKLAKDVNEHYGNKVQIIFDE